MKAVKGLFIAMLLVAFASAAVDHHQHAEHQAESNYSVSLDMIEYLKEAGVEIFDEPQMDSKKCAPEWPTFGTLCEESSLAEYATLDAAALKASAEGFKSVLENFARDMSIIFKGAEFIHKHTLKDYLSHSSAFFFLDPEVHQSLLEFKTLVTEILKNKDAVFTRTAKFLSAAVSVNPQETTPMFTPNLNSISACWGEMARFRQNSLCSICSGRNLQYFFKEKALIENETCIQLLSVCQPSFYLIKEFAEGMANFGNRFLKSIRKMAAGHLKEKKKPVLQLIKKFVEINKQIDSSPLSSAIKQYADGEVLLKNSTAAKLCEGALLQTEGASFIEKTQKLFETNSKFVASLTTIFKQFVDVNSEGSANFISKDHFLELFNKKIDLHVRQQAEKAKKSLQKSSKLTAQKHSIPFFLRNPLQVQLEKARQIQAYKKYLARLKAAQIKKIKEKQLQQIALKNRYSSQRQHYDHRHRDSHHPRRRDSHHSKRRDSSRRTSKNNHWGKSQSSSKSGKRGSASSSKPRLFASVGAAFSVKARSSSRAVQVSQVTSRAQFSRSKGRKLEMVSSLDSFTTDKLFSGDVKVLDVQGKTDSAYTSFIGATGTSGNEASTHMKHMPMNMTMAFP